MDIRAAMPSALRHHVEADERLWAQVVSLCISPPVVWTIWVVLIALRYSRDTLSALLFASAFALGVCILPILFIAYMVKIGRIGDLLMRRSQERYLPYSVAIVGNVAAGAVFLAFGAHPVLLLVALVCIVELTIMLVVTFFSHISLHAMAMANIIAATAIMFGFSQSLVFLPVLLLVILARLALKRHTPAQLLAGALIGTLTPLAVIAALGLAL